MWADRRISKLEDSSNDIIQSEEPKEKKTMKKPNKSLRDLWDSIKCANICIMGVTGGGEWSNKNI